MWAWYVFFIAIAPLMSSIAAMAATLTPFAAGPHNFFPTELKCPTGDGTGTLESLQLRRDRARVFMRWEYESRSLLSLRFYAAIPGGALELKFHWVPGTAMNDRERDLFEKAKYQGSFLLREICLKGGQARREFQSIMRTNEDILNGKLAED